MVHSESDVWYSYTWYLQTPVISIFSANDDVKKN